jgi:hypothetical protein
MHAHTIGGMRKSVMGRLLGLGLVATAVTAAVIIGVRLTAAVAEISRLAATADVAEVETQAAPHDGSARAAPPLDTAPPAALVPSDIALEPVGDEDALPLLPKSELALQYFGDDVSLNDLGQLQSPDPEFDRSMRQLADERGEIEAND